MAATNLVFDTRVSPFLPNPSGSHVGFGWTDAQTNTWSTDASSNIISASGAVSPASLLFRPGSGAGTTTLTAGTQENSLNQRIKVTFTLPSISVSNGPVIVLRSNNNSASLNGYLFLISPAATQMRGYHTVAGVSTQFYTSGTVTFVAGHSYTMDVEVAQTNGTTSTFTISLIDNTASTTPISAASITDTTATLQNPTSSGIAIDSTGNGFAQTVTQVQYYTDLTVNAAAAATAYTVTLGSTGSTGSAQTGTITVTGTTMSSSLSVTFTSSAGSTISPNPVVLTSGQGTGSFTYTPVGSGTDTISWTYSGGNGGMTGNGNQSESITLPITPLDSNLFWTDGWLLASGGAYTNNSGNYLKMAFTGTTLVVTFDVTNIKTGSVTTAEWPVIRYSVDGGVPVDLLLADQGSNTYTLTLTGSLTGAATHTLYLVLRSETQTFNRWTTNGSGFPPSGVRVQNFVLSFGSTTASLTGTALALKSSRAYVFGDSISEGSKTSYPYTPVYADSEATWGNATCGALNCEYTNYAFSGQAYSGQLGVPDVPHFGSAWNLRFSGQTKLSSGAFITNSGSPSPTYILINMGTNDAANSASKTVGSVTAVVTAIKAAAPGAIIVLVMPFAYHATYFSAQGYGAFLLSEYQNYLATDSTAMIVDLGVTASVGLGSYPASGSATAYSVDQLHPSGQRSTNLGSLVAQQIVANTTITRPKVFYY